MAKLNDTAQMVMDLYFQQFKTDEDFFTLFHFSYLVGVAYSKILEDEYKEARNRARQEEGLIDEITLQADWLTIKEIDVKRIPDEPFSFEAELPARPFSFPYDRFGYGVQSIRNVDAQGCKIFIRATEDIEWQICAMPMTHDVYFFTRGRKIIIKNARCRLNKIKVSYLPEITDPELGADGGDIPKSKEEMVIGRTLALMMQARQGTVIDMSNNSNPNKALATEVDNLFANVRTRPT